MAMLLNRHTPLWTINDEGKSQTSLEQLFRAARGGWDLGETMVVTNECEADTLEAVRQARANLTARLRSLDGEQLGAVQRFLDTLPVAQAEAVT